ncbi:2,3-bisphosphoglycerate-independent phosphoglycerate mutase [Rickettsiales bacterium LUAb2]
MTQKINPVILCILDGVGENPNTEFNAVKLAKTPNLTRIIKENHNVLIRTDGENVGLPEGQMGNSEVGHTNIGAGRIVFQDLPRINNSIKNNEFYNQHDLQQTVNLAKQKNSTVHIMGLFSNGGIHSHLSHFLAATKVFAMAGISVKLHLFTDGRDTPPTSFNEFLNTTNKEIESFKNVAIASICGRYYAMDRDKRWERTEAAYNAIVSGKGLQFNDCLEAAKHSYQDLEQQQRIASDEFIIPSVINNYSGMNDNDIIFMINFRADRARQILNALVNPNFNDFKRNKTISFAKALGMVNYSEQLDQYLTSIFPNIDLNNTLGEVLSNNKLKQLRAAETEKYPHVTFFFSGGIEEPFPLEDRALIPSPKVATYDLQPEMSAFPLKDAVVKAMNSKQYDFIVVNFANGDMVGHTGVLNAAIAAVEAVDTCVGEVELAAKNNGYTMLITADHGNCENMWDYTNNAPHTQHTTNPVRLILANPHKQLAISGLKTGKLADLAPTILKIMGLQQPKEMTGTNLINTK